MEPDRTPHVLVHHHELTRPATHLLPHHHRTDLRDHHRSRTHHQSRTRHEWYQKDVKISDTDIASLPLTRHEWHGDWNYTLASPTPNDSTILR